MLVLRGSMNITICEFPDEAEEKERAWQELATFCQTTGSDIVLLPEMPFCDWKIFMRRDIDEKAWAEAVAVHDMMAERFSELSSQIIVSSRPIDRNYKRLNQAFFWTPESGNTGGHCKYYLPDEPDGWEATWFSQGDLNFEPVDAGKLKIGFQICTELLFSERSREIGVGGGHLIAAPRATTGHRRWPVAASAAAVMSGCFVASTNRRSKDPSVFAGESWLFSPEGEMLAATSSEEPFKTVSIDLSEADAAKLTYPRNIYIS